MGRHTHPDDLESPEPDLDPILAARTAAAVPPSAQSAKTPAKTSPVADLQLVLHDRRLLRLCLVAALTPFVAYFAVVVGLHQLHVWAIFLGAPLVLAGVLVGAILDRAYAQRANPRERDQPAPAAVRPAAVGPAVIAPASAIPAEQG
jgi:hypothetical protein